MMVWTTAMGAPHVVMDDRRRVVGQFSTPEFAQQAADAVNQRDEFLAALEEIVNCWDGPTYKHVMAPNIDRARAVIAKARGEINSRPLTFPLAHRIAGGYI